METIVMGLRTHYISLGQGEPVLILHGWGASGRVYQAMAEQLAAKYRVIVPDLPGFGQSQEPNIPFCVDDYADFVLEFLKPMGIKRICLIGHSFGGRIIIKLANRALPFEIDKIVLIDSAGIRPQPSKKRGLRQRCYKIGKWFFTRKPVAKAFPGALEALRVRFGSADYAAASPMMRQCLVRAVNEDLTSLLPGITPPTLLVWGENDTATPVSDARLMEKTIPNAGLALIAGAGHYSFLDQPYVFRRILASFFRLEETV